MASWSSRMAKALQQGKVVVQNRAHGEITLRYINHAREKVNKLLAPKQMFELCPKHCPISYVKFSNIKDLQQRRALRIVLDKK